MLRLKRNSQGTYLEYISNKTFPWRYMAEKLPRQRKTPNSQSISEACVSET